MREIDEIWKSDAIERMADNDRVIELQKQRIEVLEFNLEKLRALIYEGYVKTSGLVPIAFEAEKKPKTSRKNATA